MLSYRHAYHAGNFGDVIKHIVLVEILTYLIRKETGFTYVDTHAGAGLYDLSSPQATRLREHTAGIGRLQAAEFPELARYFSAIHAVNPQGVLAHYPGSPQIATAFLRPQDSAWLYELHPADAELLREHMRRRRTVQVRCEDGFAGLLAHLPPPSRRGIVLIDPSYEIKTDYQLVVSAVTRAYRKFNSGIYAVWYPVVLREQVQHMQRAFTESGIRDIQQFEIAIAPDSDGRGMTAAGMIVVNPPWGLADNMAALLPRLASVLSEQGSFECEVLVAE